MRIVGNNIAEEQECRCVNINTGGSNLGVRKIEIEGKTDPQVLKQPEIPSTSRGYENWYELDFWQTRRTADPWGASRSAAKGVQTCEQKFTPHDKISSHDLHFNKLCWLRKGNFPLGNEIFATSFLLKQKRKYLSWEFFNEYCSFLILQIAGLWLGRVGRALHDCIWQKLCQWTEDSATIVENCSFRTIKSAFSSSSKWHKINSKSQWNSIFCS